MDLLGAAMSRERSVSDVGEVLGLCEMFCGKLGSTVYATHMRYICSYSAIPIYRWSAKVCR